MNLENLKDMGVVSVCSLMQSLSLSRSQLNRKLKETDDIMRSLDEKGKFVAHKDFIKQRTFKSEIAFIEGHVFSTEKNIISAMIKCIKNSKCGRTRISFEEMFKCKDLGKSFRKLETIDDIVIIKLNKKILYLHREKKRRANTKLLSKKGLYPEREGKRSNNYRFNIQYPKL